MRGRLLGGVGVVGTAVVGALAAALITPDSVRGSDADPPSSSASPPPAYKRVANRDGALALEVPAPWAVTNPAYEEKGRSYGPGLAAGEDPYSDSRYTKSRVFLGASRTLAAELGKGGESLSAGLLSKLRAEDWTIDGCEFDREVPFSRADDGVAGAYRVWRGCASTDSALYNGYFAPQDSSYVVVLQMELQSVDAGAAEAALGSFRVLPERLPGLRSADLPTP